MPSHLILVTNDDGVHAPGLRALAEALAPLGEVHVVAPESEASGSSQSLSRVQPPAAERLEERVHAVQGTPADCVSLAVLRLLPRRPRLVVSGINRGANLGDDVYYSGTVGAAREAALLGLPAFAVSLAARGGTEFGVAAEFSRRLASLVLERGLPERTLLNVNVPPGRPLGALITVQGPPAAEEGVRPRRPEPRVGESGAGPTAPLSDEMFDVSALRHGMISVTPLQTDATHRAVLDSLRQWERALRDGRP